MEKTFLTMFLLLIIRIVYSQNPCIGVPVIYYGDKTYNIVQIGSHFWLMTIFLIA